MDKTYELTIINGVAFGSVSIRTIDGHTHVYRFAIKRWLDACLAATVAATEGRLSWSDAAWLSLAIHRQVKYHSKVMKGLRR